MKTQTISIIGLNRIGGSMALAIKQSALEVSIIGHDRDAALIAEAEKMGMVDKGQRSLARAAAAADIVIMNVPLADLEVILGAIGDVVAEHALILDLSGGKAAGLKWAKSELSRGHYVGASLVLTASALADGRTGLQAARADLFKDSVFCVMPAATAEPKAVETAVNLGHLLGATPFFVDATEFDSLVQGTETVPGLLAAAMFNAVHKATGWRDMLRFAGLSFAQTTNPLGDAANVSRLALENKAATLRWLDALLQELQRVRKWIEEGEKEVLAAMLEELELERNRWLQQRADNSWLEVKAPQLDHPGFAQQMFGGLARGRDRKEER
jgi:prephenate dehydrogenase